MPINAEEIEVAEAFPVPAPKPEDVRYKLVLPHIITDAYGKQVDIGQQQNVSIAELNAQKVALTAQIAEIDEKIEAIEGL